MRKGQLVVHQLKLSKKHDDCFWYDGLIAEGVSKAGTLFELHAAGDILIYSKDHELVYDCKERNSGIKGGLNDDDDLKKIGMEMTGDYYWENNNWFEIIFMNKGDKFFESRDIVYSYDEALKLMRNYVRRKTEVC